MANPNQGFWAWIFTWFSAPTVPPAPARQPDRGFTPPTAPAVPPARPAAGKKTLAGVIGLSAAATAALFTMIPAEESGRVVTTNVQADGTIRTKHVRGNQHLRAYRDIVGVLTICDGDTANVRPGQVATPEECDQRLERQLIAHAEPIIQCVPQLRGRAYQVVPAVSLAYNIGPGNPRTNRGGFCGSTAARRFRAGDWLGGCNAFLSWNKAGGRVIRGLERRRHREREYCVTGLSPNYTVANLEARLRPWR